MSRGRIVSLAAIGSFLLLVSMIFFGYQGFVSGANGFENQVKAHYDNNKNVYDNGWKMVKEIAQVPDMYADRVREITEAAIAGRYGDNGARQVFLAVQEVNPTIDPSLYRQIQQAMETFRRQFQQNQTELIAVKQGFENYLTANLSGRVFNSFAHYPHIDMTAYGIVTSDRTEADFGTKRSEPLNLRP